MVSSKPWKGAFPLALCWWNDSLEALITEAVHATQATATYLLGMPLQGDHLEEALSQFGYSHEDYEMGRR